MPKTLSGRKVVLGMFSFGIVMTATMWLYWEAYTRPFRPLQYAINAEFPGSSPRVIGGEHKSHKHENPTTLRIVIRVDFDPREASENVTEPYTQRLLKLAAEHVDLSTYQQVEVHLVHRVPEAETEQRKFVFHVSEIKTTASHTTTGLGGPVTHRDGINRPLGILSRLRSLSGPCNGAVTLDREQSLTQIAGIVTREAPLPMGRSRLG